MSSVRDRLRNKLKKRQEEEEEQNVKAGNDFLEEVFGQTDADGTPLTFDEAVRQVERRRAHRKAVDDSLKEEEEYGANMRASIKAIELLEMEKKASTKKKKKKKKKPKIGDRLKEFDKYFENFKEIIEEWKTKKSDDELKEKQGEILDYIRSNKYLKEKLVVKGGYATHLHVGDKYITDDIDMVYLIEIQEDHNEVRKELTSLFKGWYDRDGNESTKTQVIRQMKDNSMGDELSEIKPLKIYHKIEDKQPILEITFEKIDKKHKIEKIQELKVFKIDSLLNILLKVSENFKERLIARKTQQTTESIYDKKIFNWYNQMRELLRVYNKQYFDELYPEEKKGGRKKRTRKKKRKYKKRKSRRKKGSGGVCSRPIRVTPINTSLNVVPGVVVHEVTANAPTASELRMAVPYDDGERDVGMIRLRQGLNNNNSTRPINPLRLVLEHQMENNRRNQEQRRLQQLQERINRAWEGGKRKKKRKKKTKKRKRRKRRKKTRRR